jgi:hypothetical protein
VKREAKIKENYDRISATLAAHDSKTNKNPTRIIPDVPGTLFYLIDIIMMMMMMI